MAESVKVGGALHSDILLLPFQLIMDGLAADKVSLRDGTIEMVDVLQRSYVNFDVYGASYL